MRAPHHGIWKYSYPSSSVGGLFGSSRFWRFVPFAQGGRAAAIRREKDKDFLVIILIVIIDCGTSEAQPGRLDRTNRRSSFTLRVVAAIARETVVRDSFSR